VIYFTLYIFIQLNSGYYSKGMVVSNRRKIIKAYAKKDLIIDLITLLPLYLAYAYNIFWL